MNTRVKRVQKGSNIGKENDENTTVSLSCLPSGFSMFCMFEALNPLVLKGGACHLACFIWVIEHFVHEDRVVQSQAKANWMCDGKVIFGHLGCISIGLACLLSSFALLITTAELRDVAVVVCLTPKKNATTL